MINWLHREMKLTGCPYHIPPCLTSPVDRWFATKLSLGLPVKKQFKASRVMMI